MDGKAHQVVADIPMAFCAGVQPIAGCHFVLKLRSSLSIGELSQQFPQRLMLRHI
jgi:hypothetical protein